MRRAGEVALLGMAATMGAALVGRQAALAANNPTFRDCSAFVEGVDPDFVQISGVVVSSGGSLTVAKSQSYVPVTASESSDPGDSHGHVTLTLTVQSPGAPTQRVSGAAVGKVILQAPLPASRPGRTYTISWSAVFDNGNHPCPSPLTPDNTPSDPHPFALTVARQS